MRDRTYLHDVTEVLAAIDSQARAAYKPGMTADQLRASFAPTLMNPKTGWLAAWRSNLGSYPALPLIWQPLGPILLLALIRWRQSDARLLLLLAVVPHTVAAYEELPLFLIPNNPRETFVLLIGSHAAQFVQAWSAAHDYNVGLVDAGFLVTMYVPALAMILRRPPRLELD